MSASLLRILTAASAVLATAAPALAHDTSEPHVHGVPLLVMLVTAAVLAAAALIAWNALSKANGPKRDD